MPRTADALIAHVDHLVFAAPDLADGVAHVESMFGVSTRPGGRHPDFGTANALVNLGNSTYLEIVGPDPKGTAPVPPSIFRINELATPRLVTWAAKASGLTDRSQHDAIPELLGTVSAGHRTRADGTRVSWQLSDPYTDRLGGVVPFLIDWGTSDHPSESLDQPCQLTALAISHPEPEVVRSALSDLDIPGDVPLSWAPRLMATIDTPAGTVRLM